MSLPLFFQYAIFLDGILFVLVTDLPLPRQQKTC
jgi:hypothetical protein